MADPTEPFSTLDDFLLSLADGITQAQAELARAGALGPPGRQFAYHLPRVDFELRMNLRVVEDAGLSSRYRMLRPMRANDKHLLFKPVAAEEASSTLEIAAVVRGAFVAVPANDGLPSIVLRTTVTAEDPAAPIVRITARNAAGEAVTGLDVQVNVDREESAALTEATGRTLVLDAGTGFDAGVVTTGAGGTADAVLRIPKTQGPGLLALVFDAAGLTETLVYEVRA
jgi:hypothetical protein